MYILSRGKRIIDDACLAREQDFQGIITTSAAGSGAVPLLAQIGDGKVILVQKEIEFFKLAVIQAAGYEDMSFFHSNKSFRHRYPQYIKAENNRQEVKEMKAEERMSAQQMAAQLEALPEELQRRCADVISGAAMAYEALMADKAED